MTRSPNGAGPPDSLSVNERKGPPFFHHHTRHSWAQPGDEPHRVFILKFADPDMRDQVFTDEGAQERAFDAYRKYSPSWNVYLFATVASDELTS